MEPLSKVNDRHVHPTKAPTVYEALCKLQKNKRVTLLEYVRLQWLNNETNFYASPLEVCLKTPKNIIASYSPDILANINIVSFTYVTKVKDTEISIKGEFLTAIPTTTDEACEIPLERGKDKLVEAVKLGRETVIGNRDGAPPSENIPQQELYRPVDDIICKLWRFSYADNTQQLSKMIREASGIPPVKSRKKPVLSSKRKRREAVTRLAEKMTKAQVLSVSPFKLHPRMHQYSYPTHSFLIPSRSQQRQERVPVCHPNM